MISLVALSHAKQGELIWQQKFLEAAVECHEMITVLNDARREPRVGNVVGEVSSAGSTLAGRTTGNAGLGAACCATCGSDVLAALVCDGATSGWPAAPCSDTTMTSPPVVAFADAACAHAGVARQHAPKTGKTLKNR